MEFCPTCGNLLQIEPARNGRKLRYFCPTCPYVCPVSKKIVRKEHIVRKEAPPIFDSAEAKKNWPKTEAPCPQCGHGEALFQQMQIRSADEPMTRFYKCCNEDCNFSWRED